MPYKKRQKSDVHNGRYMLDNSDIIFCISKPVKPSSQ